MEVIPDEAGLQGKEYIPRSAFKTSEGKILFGGVNGFNVLNPDSLKINSSISKIIFTSLKINNDEIIAGREYAGGKILTQSISQAKDIALPYNDNSFTLTFSPLIYNLQSRIQYAYKLENFDKDWQYTDARERFLHYTNLDPGRYQLKIKASLDGKSWSDPPQVLSIMISPPWWATIPFRVLSVFLGLGILYGIYKGRVGLLKAQKKRLETLVQKRTLELKKSNDEIQHLLDELAVKKDLIEEQNHELLQVNDAVVQQRDTLEIKSTELERAQWKLKEANANLEQLIAERTQKLSDTLQELETFLYRASHDLRGPITSMLGVINLFSIEKSNNDIPENYSQLLRKSVQQLDVTLDKLLLKHTIDKKPIAPEFFDKEKLEAFLTEITTEVPSFRKEDFKTTVFDNAHFHADSLMLKTILIGLLENAFFFSAKSANTEVSLEVLPNGKFNVFQITDYGAGIKPELKDKIFQMFYRGHESSTGNGLGLYMAKSALEKIKGSIEVESEDGRYSIFKVFIPMN
jgi:signal transduction histidine kinase